MDRQDAWEFVAWFCAMYVFVGIGVIGLAWSTGNWWLFGGAVLAYPLNLVLLDYAKKHGWGKGGK